MNNAHPTATFDRLSATEAFVVLQETTLPYSKMTRNVLLVSLRDQKDPIQVPFAEGKEQVTFMKKAISERIEWYKEQDFDNHPAIPRLENIVEELETVV